MAPKTITLDAYGIEEKTVKRSGKSSGRVYVPASWIGKKVSVILEEPDDETKLELSRETEKAFMDSLDDYKRGETISHDEIMRKYGLNSECTQ